MLSQKDRAGAIDEVRAITAPMIQEITAEREEKLAEFVRLHEEDARSYSFRCERHGDFLAVFMARGPSAPNVLTMTRAPRKYARAINLGSTRTITLYLGCAPDMAGVVRFRGYNYSSGPEVQSVYDCEAYPRVLTVTEDVTSPQNPQNLFGMPAGYYNGDYVAEALMHMHVADCPRGATDDRIVFSGIGVNIYAPAGLGQGVYNAIMSSLAAQT